MGHVPITLRAKEGLGRDQQVLVSLPSRDPGAATGSLSLGPLHLWVFPPVVAQALSHLLGRKSGEKQEYEPLSLPGCGLGNSSVEGEGGVWIPFVLSPTLTLMARAPTLPHIHTTLFDDLQNPE